MRAKHLAIGISALFLLAGSSMAKEKAGRVLQVPYELPKHRAGLLVQVWINDLPAVLILDTGSTHTIIHPRVLGSKGPKVAGVTPAHPFTKGVGLIGDGVAHEVQLQLGDWKWKRRTVVVMNLAQLLAVYDERVDGLLGLDFLQEFSSVSIDMQRKNITFRK